MNHYNYPADQIGKSTKGLADRAARLASPRTNSHGAPLWLSGAGTLLAALLLFFVLSAGAQAQYATTLITKSGTLGLQIVQSHVLGGNITIPDVLNGPSDGSGPKADYPVLDIGPNAFMYTAYPFQVTIPDSIRDIGPSAFAYCTGLTSVTMSTTGTTIGSSAFTYCTGLTSVTMPPAVQSIGDSAFSTCTGLTSVVLSGSSMGNAAFQYCTALTSITIPGTFLNTGDAAFQYCTALKSITLGAGIGTIGVSVFQYCEALEGITFPSTIFAIGGAAFDSCNRLTTITIPSYIRFIGGGAFSNCKRLTSIFVGYHVSAIWDGAFSNCPALTNVSLPDSVTYIGNGAFRNCPVLKYSTGTNNFTIPSTVTDIGPSAFAGCTGLATIAIPDSVTSIYNSAFANCAGLNSVTIGNGVTHIWDSAFSGCSGLASVTIGNNVTEIGGAAFSGCAGLTTVLFLGDGPSPNPGAFDNTNLPLYYLAGANWWDPTFDGHPTAPWPGPIKGLSPNHGPAVGGTNVVIIGSNFTSATSVQFGGVAASFHIDSATQITAVAPAGTAGQQVDVRVVTPLGTTINTVADQFTYDNPVLAVTGLSPSHSSAVGAINVVIHGSFFTGATSVKFGATAATSFSVDSDTQITAVAPAGVEGQKVDVIVTTPSAVSTNTSADDFIYDTVSYTYTVNNGAVTITGYTGAVGVVIIPSAVNGLPVTSIADSGFENCYGLTSITIPSSITSIGAKAFKNCYGLTSIIIPNSVTSIGASAFENCTGLTNAFLGNGVAIIGNLAFSNCTGLTGVTLGINVTTIGTGAFQNCDGLAGITIPNSVLSIGDAAFSGCTGLSSVTIGTGVTSIGIGAFQFCDGLARITLPNSLTSIGANAFSNCNGLTQITIPNKVASVGSDAFSSCNHLTSIVISNGITKIWDSALSDCPALTSVTIPSSVTQIGVSSFSNCPVLNNVIIPDYVTDIGANAFTQCTGLINVTIGRSVTHIENLSFSGCTGLVSLTIPDNVTSIGNGAFAGCTRLITLTVGNGVTNIGDSAFSNCSRLSIVRIGTGVSSIGVSAFGGCDALISVLFLGNAPSPDSPVFDRISQTIYYLAGATGWGPTFDGLPTAQWPGPIFALSPSHGSAAGGTSVVISGNNFTSATAVKFGALAATSFIVNSPTQITAVAPAGTVGQQVDVSVVTPDGTTPNTVADLFTYDDLVPTLTGLTPSHGRAAGGTSVIIAGTKLTGATSVKFGSVAAASFTVNSATQITAVAPAGTAGQQVDVTITTANGTTAVTAADNFTYDIPAPTVTRVSPVHGPVAGGTSVVVLGANLNGATAVRFGSVAAASFIVNSSTQITAVAPAGTAGQQVDVSVTTLGGASAATVVDHFYYNDTADGIAPTALLYSPGAGGVASSFNVNGVATDNQGVDRVEVKLNGGPVQFATLSGSNKGTSYFNLSGVTPENGKNTLAVQSFDFQGNSSPLVTVVLNYVNTRPGLAGAYNGLLLSGSGITPSNNLSGFVTVSVTSAGLFTGKVTLGGFVLPVSGIFGNDGVAYFQPSMAASLSLVANSTPPVLFGNVALTLDATGTSGKIIGTLKDPNNVTLSGINADHVFFDGKTNFVDPKYLKNKGLHTVVFANKAQQGSPSSSTYPQGDGFGSLTVSAKGIATLKGTLADGTTLTAAAPLSKTYLWPCFAQLYSKHGSIAGYATLDGSNPVTALKGLDLLWFRPAISTSKYYPGGWTGGVTVDLLGSEYAVPVTSAISPATSVFANLKGIDLVSGNATLEFSDGKLTGGNNPLDKNVNIAPNNKVTNLTVSNVLDKSFVLKLTVSSGMIKGTFTYPDGTKPAFKGVILQHDVNAGSYILNAGGYGFFLSTPPAVTGGTGESGGMSLFAH